MHDASGRASETSCIDHRADSAQGPESLHESHMTQYRLLTRGSQEPRPVVSTLLTLLVLVSVVALATACGSQGSGQSSNDREAALRQVATEYAQTGDLSQARAALDKLSLANPGQLLLALAEADSSAGRPREEVQVTARLAEALGARSQTVIAYLAPTAAPAPAASLPTSAPTVLAASTEPPASPTTEPPTAGAPTPAPAATDVPATATTVPPTSTPEPQNPRVLASGDVNLRGGPGRAYNVVGRLTGGQEAPIIGRNASGDWWQVEVSGLKQAWVAGTVVKVLGAIDTVAVAQNIPPAPTVAPRPTAAPQPTTAPVAAGPDFNVIEKRLWNVKEIGGTQNGNSINCGYRRELHVRVVDAAGNPLNGVTVKAHLGDAKEEIVTGHKGVPGDAEFVLGGGQEVSIIRDVDGHAVTSDYVAGLTTTSGDIPRDVLSGAGYCVEDGTCDAFLKNNGCSGHHSWTVTFRRAY